MMKTAALLASAAFSLLSGGAAFAQDVGPPVLSFRDSLCYGFPGCPDSYLFLLPTLAVLGMLRFSSNVYVLCGAWVFALVVLAIILQVNPIRVTVYLLAALSVGLVWLAFGGARR